MVAAELLGRPLFRLVRSQGGPVDHGCISVGSGVQAVIEGRLSSLGIIAVLVAGHPDFQVGCHVPLGRCPVTSTRLLIASDRLAQDVVHLVAPLSPTGFLVLHSSLARVERTLPCVEVLLLVGSAL